MRESLLMSERIAKGLLQHLKMDIAQRVLQRVWPDGQYDHVTQPPSVTCHDDETVCILFLLSLLVMSSLLYSRGCSYLLGDPMVVVLIQVRSRLRKKPVEYDH
jgi:hypothetical protein